MRNRIYQSFQRFRKCESGNMFAEYLLLLTIVGIGVITGVAAVRSALIDAVAGFASAIGAGN